ncbi:hypothetical protein [uncultured Microbacterium sp.]|uniref:hypothetical protein n=1 Tax=uncultured Microbacterium sp. TaxID=191216 RepID=UPI0025E56EE6|nr:hypothetical protein [uncultured Microbacterium sp.]
MSELKPLEDAVSANMGRLLHGSEDEARDAVDRMLFPADTTALFGTLCGLFATVAGEALKEHRASLPPGPARGAPFGMLAPAGMDLPSRTAAQLVTASANDDRPTVMALLRAALSWQEWELEAKLAARLALHARMMHQSICDDVTRDLEGGA